MRNAQKSNDKQKSDYEEIISQKNAIIKELENRLAHELALKGHDGTNMGRGLCGIESHMKTRMEYRIGLSEQLDELAKQTGMNMLGSKPYLSVKLRKSRIARTFFVL